jgi:hypothetical protein
MAHIFKINVLVPRMYALKSEEKITAKMMFTLKRDSVKSA